MNEIEARNTLEYFHKDLAVMYAGKEMPIGVKRIFDAYETAIKALNKQIPRRKHRYVGIRCVCGLVVASNQDYCDSCGQRLLEWKEVK